MFDISNFLKEAFSPEPSTPWGSSNNSLLPNIEISPKLQKNIEQIALDFISGLYFSSKKTGDLASEVEVWFLEEINQGLHLVYPNKTRREYTAILHQIIKMADPNYGK